jgi:hypothetical protein
MIKLIATATLTFALGAIALSPTLAQTVSPMSPKMGMMGGACAMMGAMGPGMMGQGMMGRQARMGAMFAGRLAYLKDELNITDTQADAWKAYADAVGSRVEVMQNIRQNMMRAVQQGNAIERLEAHIRSMEAILEAMKAVKPATEKLYAVLTDEQKRVADELIGMDCGAM